MKYRKNFWITAFHDAAISFLLVTIFFSYFEPMISIAASANDSITVTQAVSSEISISSPADVTMSSAIPGMTGNLGSPRTGSATWTVKTGNTTGFILALKASTAPAMRLDATYNFSDYSPAVAGTPDYNWISPAASEAEFGYTVEPATSADAAQIFKDNASNACNSGSTQTPGKCWYNFTISDVTVINRSTATLASGEAETVNFQTESNAKYLKEGSYTATITATATEN